MKKTTLIPNKLGTLCGIVSLVLIFGFSRIWYVTVPVVLFSLIFNVIRVKKGHTRKGMVMSIVSAAYILITYLFTGILLLVGHAQGVF